MQCLFLPDMVIEQRPTTQNNWHDGLSYIVYQAKTDKVFDKRRTPYKPDALVVCFQPIVYKFLQDTRIEFDALSVNRQVSTCQHKCRHVPIGQAIFQRKLECMSICSIAL